MSKKMYALVVALISILSASQVAQSPVLRQAAYSVHDAYALALSNPAQRQEYGFCFCRANRLCICRQCDLYGQARLGCSEICAV